MLCLFYILHFTFFSGNKFQEAILLCVRACVCARMCVCVCQNTNCNKTSKGGVKNLKITLKRCYNSLQWGSKYFTSRVSGRPIAIKLCNAKLGEYINRVPYFHQ